MGSRRLRRVAGSAVAAFAVLVTAVGTGAASPVPGSASDSQARTASLSRSANTPPATGVTADALPTAQIDGVVWSQVVVGDTVFAGGQFGTARPPGALPRQNTVRRTDLMSYSISTGALGAFAPVLNGQVLSVAVSPDNTRLYVGGDFTIAGSVARSRIAAFDTRTGQLIAGFAPKVNSTVDAIVATNSYVFLGGSFTAVNGVTRGRLAAVTAASGALTAWAPSANARVAALVLTPDRSLMIAGGAFTTVNGSAAYGLAALKTSAGQVSPWAVSSVVRDAGTNSAITSLFSDGTSIFGSGYVYGKGGNFEGTFSVTPDSGALRWMEDCHGDSYGVYVSGGEAYVVSHAHYCGNVGGFGETLPRVNHRATAFLDAASGTVQTEPYGYANFAGNPSPQMVNWFPDLTIGTATGQAQAAWSVTGNGRYVVLGGEFPTVNGVPQQGLVRFTTRAYAPNKQGPVLSGVALAPRLSALTTTSSQLRFQTDFDPDDVNLTYTLTRSDSSTPIWSATVASTLWNRPIQTVTLNDTVPGTTYTYQLTVSDPSGNTAVGTPVSWTAPSTLTTAMNYLNRVVTDGAVSYYPLNEPTGLGAVDQVGFGDGKITGTVTRSVAGPVAGNPASTLSNAVIALNPEGSAPFTYSAQLWVRTTTTAGGPLIEYGSSRDATAPAHDREVYLGTDGRVVFSVSTGKGRFATVTAPTPINDGEWHQVTAGESAAGMVLFVDGQQVGVSTSRTNPYYTYLGVWRVGSENLAGWPGASSATALAGDVAQIAIYKAALSADTVAAQYAVSGRGQAAPTGTYGASVAADAPASYWRLGEAAGPVASDASGHANTAAYAGDVRFGLAGAPVGGTDTAVQFGPRGGYAVGTNSVVDPEAYSQEAWIRTSSTTGGVIADLSASQRSVSSAQGRVLYLGADGRVLFSPDGSSAIASTQAVNDGRWHHLVATASASGTALFVDGAQVATGPAVTGPAVTGFWRIGGDGLTGAVDQPTSTAFAGLIDEVALYHGALTAARVAAHYSAGIGTYTGPSASFTATTTSLTVQTDASASADPGATTPTYSWDFGDATTPGTGVTASHSYSAPGTYQVTLTVTDERGGQASSTSAVTVTS